MKMTLRGTAALRLLAAGAFCFGVGIALASAGNAATLLSGDVTVGNYYPNTSTLYQGFEGTGPTTSTISLSWSGYAFTFTADTFTWFDPYGGTSFNTYPPGGFNGFILSFTGVAPITGVTFASGEQATSVNFNSDTIWLGYNGGPRPGGYTTYGVSFGVAPEPATWAMMLLGFASLGYAGYRGRRPAVAAAL